MDVSAIKPDLIVHARSLEVMQIPEDVHVGKVDSVEGEYVKLKVHSTEDAHSHWIPLTWIESISEEGVFLNKNVEEYMWGRLDEKPAQ